MDKKYYEGLLETEKRGRSSVLSGNIVPGVGDASIEPATQLPLMDGEEADVGRSNRYAREDHIHPRDDTKVDKVEGYGLSQISTVEKVDGLYQMVLSDGEKIYVPTTDISLKDMVVCETRGDLATKEITLPYRLYEGMHIIIKFTKTNIISPEDLRLKVNGLPEKTIRYRNGWLPSADTLSNGRIYDFVYYNDGFELVGDLDIKGGEGIPSPATAAPAMDGTAAVGSSTKYAREDHVHPHDSSKVDKVSGKGLSTNDYTTAEKNKLAGVPSNAEANQNAFSGVKVGNTTLTATAKTDTLELVAGSNVTITPDEQNKTVTIEAAAGSAGNIGEGTGYKSVILNDTQYSYADGDYSRAQGQYTHAYGNYSNAEGYGSTAGRQDDKVSYIAGHAEGNYTEATGQAAHSEGSFTHATGSGSHSEGHTTTASGENSHSEGMSTSASGGAAHSEDANTVAEGYQAHAEGFQTIANGNTSHSEGDNTAAYGKSTHVFGAYNEYDDQVQPYDRGPYVEIVGNGNYETRSNARTLDWDGNEWIAGNMRAGGDVYSNGTRLARIDELPTVPTRVRDDARANGGVVEGENTVASGPSSHAEGVQSIAENVAAHAEGMGALAHGEGSHAEGFLTSANGSYSHSGGSHTVANGEASSAHGTYTIASGASSMVFGKYNVEDTNNEYALIIGNGSSDSARSNALAMKWDGTFVLANGTEVTPAQINSLLALLP